MRRTINQISSSLAPSDISMLPASVQPKAKGFWIKLLWKSVILPFILAILQAHREELEKEGYLQTPGESESFGDQPI